MFVTIHIVQKSKYVLQTTINVVQKWKNKMWVTINPLQKWKYIAQIDPSGLFNKLCQVKKLFLLLSG